MSRGNWVLWLAIVTTLLVLPACQDQDTEAIEEIDLKTILPDSLQTVEIHRLDPYAGAERQWLVLYRYDVTDKFSPIAGAVYRADRGPATNHPSSFLIPCACLAGTIWAAKTYQ